MSPTEFGICGVEDLLLQPIRAVEVSLRIAGKAFVSVLRENVIKYAVTPQDCAIQEAGIEAFHSMNRLYDVENTEVILLVVTSKTFN